MEPARALTRNPWPALPAVASGPQSEHTALSSSARLLDTYVDTYDTPFSAVHAVHAVSPTSRLPVNADAYAGRQNASAYRDNRVEHRGASIGMRADDYHSRDPMRLSSPNATVTGNSTGLVMTSPAAAWTAGVSVARSQFSHTRASTYMSPGAGLPTDSTQGASRTVDSSVGSRSRARQSASDVVSPHIRWIVQANADASLSLRGRNVNSAV